MVPRGHRSCDGRVGRSRGHATHWWAVFPGASAGATLSRDCDNALARDSVLADLPARHGRARWMLRPSTVQGGGEYIRIGVHLRKACWGHGYASEATRAVMAFAFDTPGARRLFAGHNPANQASRRVLEKLGFRYTHDEYYPPTGLDHPSYILTAEEFAQTRREKSEPPGSHPCN